MEYGVRWQEFDRQDRLVTKERFFATEKQLCKFMDKLQEKSSFYRIYATCSPESSGVKA